MSEQKTFIKAFVITADHETEREKNIQLLQLQLPGIVVIKAIYPKYEKVPFFDKLVAMSRQRGGVALSHGEIGVLLSNRKVWRQVLEMAETETEPFLILESDSCINDLQVLQDFYHQLAGANDIFFFGAWLGHMKLFRSSKRKLVKQYKIGEPFIKTVYSAYGYSINKKAARYLLKATNKISFPVDQYKKYIATGALKLGGIVPELISENQGESTIGHPGMHPFIEKIWMGILDIKNILICFFR